MSRLNLGMLFFVFIIYACTQSTFVEVRGKQNNTMVTCIENIEATEVAREDESPHFQTLLATGKKPD